ncbi:MAG TPA: hypothetical protein PLG41_11395 [Leptospiraceae bacterium]|nr:hypothetical protein [Leptospiraceae bacterium]
MVSFFTPDKPFEEIAVGLYNVALATLIPISSLALILSVILVVSYPLN